MEIEFAHKEFFWLMLLLPGIIVWYVLKFSKKQAKVNLSSVETFTGQKNSFKLILKHLSFSLRILSLALIITALARPQSSTSWQDKTTEGIDIIMSMDISGSMLAKDLQPDRLSASKKVAQQFITDRINDRIGLVVYAGESFTQCPLTTDHSVLINLLQDVNNGLIQDGTAIGMGLATSVNRLKDSKAKSRVVILLTDGSNNSGDIPPITAAEIAKTFDVRVYTIGVGTNGYAQMPIKLPTGQTIYEKVKVKIDEATLEKIADMTGGKYFRATDNASLQDIYKEIDELEKSKIEVIEYRKRGEEFLPWILAATILLFLEFALKNTLLKSIV